VRHGVDGAPRRATTVDRRAARCGRRWSRNGGELTITPRRGLRKREHFTTVTAYDGVPETLGNERTARSRASSTRTGARRPGSGRRKEDCARQPEIIAFLSGRFRRYPSSAAGGIVDDADGLGFALENQTRPVYSKVFWDIRSEPTDAQRRR
jgi:hypothetical protein